ncbi:hypothetical protein [Bradyrhizobium brasilense]|uniref:hypothetical protein n=1 Tax=Bradyrhizobium brasilense TaxID=1419277 RepID=UPI0026AD27F5
MSRRFAPLELDEVERAELTSLASRRSTAQALALRARIVLACAEGEQSKVVRPVWLSIPTRSASGGGVSSSIGLRVFGTSRDRGRRALLRIPGFNQVERFFALITERKIRRGIYRSVAALRAEIASFIEHHSAEPTPFRWIESADDILSSIERFCAFNSPAKAQMP